MAFIKRSFRSLFFLVSLFTPVLLFAQEKSSETRLDLSSSPIGYLSLFIFFIAYLLVMSEEFTHLRKSKPVIISAGIIWSLIGWTYANHGMSEVVEAAVSHNLLEYTELMLFLLVAMTYINSMQERGVFDILRAWLIRKGFSFRQLFWLTGFLSFFISPVADNLTTALLMCAVILAVGQNNSRFISLSCINVVIAANAGGAFSPFGDITTLMVWQSKILAFNDFIVLFIPALVNFLVPAIIMFFFIPDEQPETSDEVVILRRGARRIVVLFLMTILSAVTFHHYFGLPAVIGMLTGLGYLQLFGYYLKQTRLKCVLHERRLDHKHGTEHGDAVAFDVFVPVARAEWDTLFFFYGVVLSVGGLGFLGYLSIVSDLMYHQWGATYANIGVGIISAIIDNIPVMFAVLSMHPDMSTGQWLLVTLTAGVGGSLLSIGSAAGVALMGQARGKYTFFSHLKWTPVIAMGYFASIATHMWLNSALF